MLSIRMFQLPNKNIIAIFIFDKFSLLINSLYAKVMAKKENKNENLYSNPTG